MLRRTSVGAILICAMKTLVHIHNEEPSTHAAGEKEQLLFSKLANLPSLIVALSGGADSAYLAWAAHHVLAERALSVTALSASYSAYDREQLDKFLQTTGVRHEFIETHELENPAYRANASDRCYFCKDELFSALDRIATNRRFAAIAYGVNADDTSDFRPGHRAAHEHHILTPALRHGSDRRAPFAGRARRSSPPRIGLPAIPRPSPRQPGAHRTRACRTSPRALARYGRCHC